MREAEQMSEHRTSTNIKNACAHAALVDARNTSRLVLEGRDGLDLLHRLSTNDVLHRDQSGLMLTVLTNEKGRIIDAVRVVPFGTGHLLLGSADAEEEVLRWIEKYTIADDVAVRSITNLSTLWMLVGPEAEATTERLANTLPGVDGIFPDNTTSLQRMYLLQMGDTRKEMEERANRIGLSLLARDEWDMVRILHGMPEFGRELDPRFTPYDAGLEGFVSGTKGCYIGQEVLARIETYRKNRRKLGGFTAPSATALRVGATVFRDGDAVGQITSVGPITLRDRLIGLAVIAGDASKEGTKIYTEDGGEMMMSGLPMLSAIHDFIHE